MFYYSLRVLRPIACLVRIYIKYAELGLGLWKVAPRGPGPVDEQISLSLSLS